jgi:hypothetical protein
VIAAVPRQKLSRLIKNEHDAKRFWQRVDLSEIVFTLTLVSTLGILLLAGIEGAREFDGAPIRYPLFLSLLRLPWYLAILIAIVTSLAFWTLVASLVQRLFPTWMQSHLPWFRADRWE